MLKTLTFEEFLDKGALPASELINIILSQVEASAIPQCREWIAKNRSSEHLEILDAALRRGHEGTFPSPASIATNGAPKPGGSQSETPAK